MRTYFTPRLRRRLAPLLLVCGALALGRVASDELPRSQEVRLLLTDAQRAADQMRITYQLDGELVSAVVLNFGSGAPEVVVHHPSLKPGRYDVTVELSGPTLPAEAVARSLTVPTESAARIRLEEPDTR